MKSLDQLRTRILNLEAKNDLVLFGVYRGADGKFYREDGTEAPSVNESKSVGGMAQAVAGGIVVGAGLAGASALGKRYGVTKGVGPLANARFVGAGVKRDIATASAPVARRTGQALAGTLGNAAARANRVADVATDSAKKGRSLRRTVGLLTKAATGKIGLSTVKDRIIELSAK